MVKTVHALNTKCLYVVYSMYTGVQRYTVILHAAAAEH